MAQRPPTVRVEHGPGFSVQYNVGGVGGLHVATCLFSEAVEERLFHHPTLFPFAAEAGTDRRMERQGGMARHPPEFFAVVNAVRDSGLGPDIVQPDFLLCLSYATSGGKGARFQCHYDSRYRWGEDVLGVSLGAGSTLRMVPDDKTRPNVEVDLPRRSVYLLTGESRIAWKHGIERVGRSPGELPPPAWNPNGMRRSLTSRARKTYNTVCLRRALDALPAGQAAARAALQARIQAQQHHWPEKTVPAARGQERSFTPAEVAAAEAAARQTIHYMHTRLPHTARLPRGEVPYLEGASPAVLAQYSAFNCGLYPAAPPRAPPGPRPTYTPTGAMAQMVADASEGDGGGAAAGEQPGWGSPAPAPHPSPWAGTGRVLGGGGGGGEGTGRFSGSASEAQDRELQMAIAASLADLANGPSGALRSPSPAAKRQCQYSTPPRQQQEQQQVVADVVDLTEDGAAGAAGDSQGRSPAERLRELRLKRFA